MKVEKIIFIHGNDTMRWSYLWVPWLKEQLETLDIELVFETFPDSILARKQYWLPFLKEKLKANESTLLVGHSSGAVAAMRYAEENPIFGSVLISPCYTDLGLESEKISGWYDDPWQWEKIKTNQKTISLFYSENDEFIPLEEFLHIKEKLNPDKTFSFKEKGHFISQETFPELAEHILELVK